MANLTAEEKRIIEEDVMDLSRSIMSILGEYLEGNNMPGRAAVVVGTMAMMTSVVIHSSGSREIQDDRLSEFVHLVDRSLVDLNARNRE